MTRRDPQRLLYLSPVPLTSFAQRPHHFVHWFHQRFGGEVLWIDPGPSRLPRRTDWPRLLKLFQPNGLVLGPPWRHDPWLHHAAVTALPVEPFAWGRWLNRHLWRNVLAQADAFVTPDTVLVLGKPCALSLALVQRFPLQRCIFDAMDHMPGFCVGVSRQWMVQAEQDLASQVNALWASSHALASHHQAHAGKLSLVLNALTQPPATAPVRRLGAPVLGYLGVVDRWFDWRLLLSLAQARPDVTIRLVGPIHSRPAGPLPSNVQCLPPVPQQDVYKVMAGFDVGLIPFACNDVTAYVDPVKYYEYRALGLPVLSTRFGEMKHRNASDGVYFWDQFSSGSLSLESLMAARSDPAERQAFCESNTWQQRFDAVVDTLG